jgi:predicted RNA-binding Zn ribbon-like protein
VEFEYIAGNAVLDFHNTVAWPPRGKSNERLLRGVDLARWAEESGVLTQQEAVKLRAYVMRNYRKAFRELARAVETRDLLHRIFSDVMENRESLTRSIGPLNQRLSKIRASQRIELRNESPAWSPPTVRGIKIVEDRLLLRAAELLTSSDLERLRRCANPRCGWLFLDTTRNGIRKWCSMAECGGRAKSKRYYESRKKLKVRDSYAR